MSEALTSLLDSTGSPDAAAREIANCLALRGEARDALPALKAVATHKAGPEGVKLVIGRRLALYPQPARSEAEAAAWWADYYDVLADLSLASLEAGMRAWVSDPSSEFMPKPGKLRQLAETTPCRALQRFQRAKRAIMLAEDANPALSHYELQPTDQDRAEIRRMAAETMASLKPPGPEKPPIPSTAGKTDEGGLTEAMRALMERRAASR